MKHDFTSVQNIYIICGKTDMRKGIDGLATIIQDSFELDPYSDSIKTVGPAILRRMAACGAFPRNFFDQSHWDESHFLPDYYSFVVPKQGIS